VYKSPAELDLMRHVSQLSSLSHVFTMRDVKPGMYEYQLESLFNHHSYYNFGCCTGTPPRRSRCRAWRLRTCSRR
ncbi:hypothetical protein TeGR_g11237, partial [Tetraparma gracilis]